MSVSALTNETFLGITCDYLIQLGRAVLLRVVHVEVNAHTESNFHECDLGRYDTQDRGSREVEYLCDECPDCDANFELS